MIRLIVTEDNEVVRQGLTRLLDAEPDMTVTGQAEDGLKTISLLTEGTDCDVLLADLNMPGMDGIELTSFITANFRQIKVIILTMHAKAVFMEKARAAGAKGFVLKQVETDELIEIIRQVYHGKTHFS